MMDKLLKKELVYSLKKIKSTENSDFKVKENIIALEIFREGPKGDVMLKKIDKWVVDFKGKLD